jgi:hypothetical protein
MREVKTGFSQLGLSHQIRLQTYFSVKYGMVYTIQTSRPLSSLLSPWVTNWGINVTGIKR